MLDGGGRVIGMSTAFVFGDQVFLGLQSGIGFAVPAEWIDRGLVWIRSGAPARAWMGALAVPADPENRDRYKLPAETRLVIEHVFPDSPAAAAGVKRGDGLVSLAGDPVAQLPRVHERMMAMKPGDKLAIGVQRAAEALKIEVTLAPRPERPRLSARGVAQIIEPLDNGSTQRRGPRAAAGDRQENERPIRTCVERSPRLALLAGGERVIDRLGAASAQQQERRQNPGGPRDHDRL